MLLTKPISVFKRLPKIAVAKEMGFRAQCAFCLTNGFVPHSTPFGYCYEVDQMTRFYGRTKFATIPIDASRTLISEDYTVALSACRTMLALYYHKGFRNEYCEVVHSPDSEAMVKLFEHYHAGSGSECGQRGFLSSMSFGLLS